MSLEGGREGRGGGGEGMEGGREEGGEGAARQRETPAAKVD